MTKTMMILSHCFFLSDCSDRFRLAFFGSTCRVRRHFYLRVKLAETNGAASEFLVFGRFDDFSEALVYIQYCVDNRENGESHKVLLRLRQLPLYVENLVI